MFYETSYNDLPVRGMGQVNGINQFDLFVMEMCCVFFEEGTEFLNIRNFVLQRNKEVLLYS
jgi:hypothetical protein